MNKMIQGEYGKPWKEMFQAAAGAAGVLEEM